VPIVSPISIIDAIMESLAVVVADMDTGQIIFASKPAEEMFGFKVRGEMVGHRVEELMPARLRADHPSHRRKYSNDPHVRQMGDSQMKLIGLRTDGTEFPIEIMLIPVAMEGKRCAIGVILDVSVRKNGHGQ
jgi:PAS domain S-box-containing protein